MVRQRAMIGLISEGDADRMIEPRDPTAMLLVGSIRSGDIDTLKRLLAEDPGLVSARIAGRKKDEGRTLLHIVADWPGYFPKGPETVRLLIAAGANPNTGGGGETPLHWAASSDDVEVAQALIEGGADIEAPGGSIDGTPLANAIGYGCWHVARLLVARGARIERLWQAAALADQTRVDEFLGGQPPPTQEEIDSAFFQACAAGQRRMAEYLLDRGANIDARPDYSKQSPLQAAGSLDTRRQLLVDWLRSRGAADAQARAATTPGA